MLIAVAAGHSRLAARVEHPWTSLEPGAAPQAASARVVQVETGIVWVAWGAAGILAVAAVVVATGISRADVLNFEAWIPPLTEQRRIVAKVDELMTLCDEWEPRQQKRQEARVHFTRSAFHHLTAAKDPAELGKFLSLVVRNACLLFDDVVQLRQAILQLAVQGRLIPQNPKDEPAEALMDHIPAAKQTVAEANGQKSPKAWPKVEASEVDQEFPSNWVVVRLGDLATDIEAGYSPQCEGRRRNNDEWGVLKISAVSWDEFDPEQNKALPPNIEPRPEFEVRDNDFLMSRANTAELVAKSVIAHKPPPRLLLSDKTLRVHFTEHTDRQFVNLVNNSLSARAYYAKASSGTSSSMKNITRGAIAMLPVGVPPSAEQKRIVARVNKLMQLCNTLEEQLRQSRTLGAHLLDATIHHFLAL